MNKIKISANIVDKILSISSYVSIILSFILFKKKKIDKNIFIISLASSSLLLLKKLYNIFDQNFTPVSDDIKSEDDIDEVYDNIMKELDLEFEKEFV